MPVSLRTIGDYIDGEYTVTAYCTAYFPVKCERVHEGIDLDLEALAGKHGRELHLSEIVSRLRCRLCGAPAEIKIGHHGRPRR